MQVCGCMVVGSYGSLLTTVWQGCQPLADILIRVGWVGSHSQLGSHSQPASVTHSWGVTHSQPVSLTAGESLTVSQPGQSLTAIQVHTLDGKSLTASQYSVIHSWGVIHSQPVSLTAWYSPTASQCHPQTLSVTHSLI